MQFLIEVVVPRQQTVAGLHMLVCRGFFLEAAEFTGVFAWNYKSARVLTTDPAIRRFSYEEGVVRTERMVVLHMLIGLICPTEDGRTGLDSARESWWAGGGRWRRRRMRLVERIPECPHAGVPRILQPLERVSVDQRDFIFCKSFSVVRGWRRHVRTAPPTGVLRPLGGGGQQDFAGRDHV